MWWKVITTIVISLWCVAQVAWAETIAVKPTTPVQISIHPESTVSPGSVVSFVVRVSSSLPSDNLHITVELPPASEVMSGELQWSGSIYQGEIKEIRFSLKFPPHTVPVVSASASIQAVNGAQLAASTVYRQAMAQPAGISKSNQGRKVSREGRSVVEYSLK
ncbi:hypothetical protein [Kaarinaea lacus]